MNIINYFKSQKDNNDYDYNFLPDGIFILELDGKIIDVNQKIIDIYNTYKYNIIGHYFSDFVENGTSILNKIIQNNTTAPAKAKMQGKVDEEATPIYFEISATKKLETNRVYVIARNITGKYKKEEDITEKYEQAQRIVDEKNDFLLDSSGVILSNLVTISGFSKALLDGIGGALSEKQEKYLKIINSNARDLNYDLEKLFALFRVESNRTKYNIKPFDLISVIKSIERVYKKTFEDKKIIFNLDYSNLSQRDCNLDSEIIEYILRSIMDIFSRFANFGKCTLNIGHPPIDFLKSREFSANDSFDCEKYVLFEAKIADLTFSQDELNHIFDTYYSNQTKRPIGLRATLNLLKRYITDFRGDIWIYSKQNFGTMITFVLPLR